jgi:hypothetical protein
MQFVHAAPAKHIAALIIRITRSGAAAAKCAVWNGGAGLSLKRGLERLGDDSRCVASQAMGGGDTTREIAPRRQSMPGARTFFRILMTDSLAW